MGDEREKERKIMNLNFIVLSTLQGECHNILYLHYFTIPLFSKINKAKYFAFGFDFVTHTRQSTTVHTVNAFVV